jgi:hypothetical protein
VAKFGVRRDLSNGLENIGVNTHMSIVMRGSFVIAWLANTWNAKAPSNHTRHLPLKLTETPNLYAFILKVAIAVSDETLRNYKHATWP